MNSLFPALLPFDLKGVRTLKQQGHSRKPPTEADTLSEASAFTTQHANRPFLRVKNTTKANAVKPRDKERQGSTVVPI